MGFIGVGIALILLGLFLTFSNLFGFTLGIPLTTIGIVLVIVGGILAVIHLVTRAGRGVRRNA